MEVSDHGDHDLVIRSEFKTIQVLFSPSSHATAGFSFLSSFPLLPLLLFLLLFMYIYFNLVYLFNFIPISTICVFTLPVLLRFQAMAHMAPKQKSMNLYCTHFSAVLQFIF